MARRPINDDETATAAGEKWGLTRIPPPFAYPQHKSVSAEFGVCPFFSLLLSATTPATSAVTGEVPPRPKAETWVIDLTRYRGKRFINVDDSDFTKPSVLPSNGGSGCNTIAKRMVK